MRALALLHDDRNEDFPFLAEPFGWNVELREPSSVASASDLTSVVAAGFDLLVLPLTLPNYNSLRLAEMVHRRCLSVKTILWTGSLDADRDARQSLFDLNWTIPFEQLPSGDPPHRLTAPEARACVHKLLQTATCFRVGGRHSHRASDLVDYELAARISVPEYRATITDDLDARIRLQRNNSIPKSDQSFDAITRHQQEVLKTLNELLARTQSREVVARIEAREREAEVAEFLTNLRTWEHSTFSVGARVALEAMLKAIGADAFGLDADAILAFLRGIAAQNPPPK